jgi:hypothetical protein
MGAASQKKKLIEGMSVAKAKPRFLEIWAKMHPDKEFPRHMWAAMEVWMRLRSRNDTLEAVTQAFAEKVTSLYQSKAALERKLHAKRLELTKEAECIVKLQKEISAYKETSQEKSEAQ